MFWLSTLAGKTVYWSPFVEEVIMGVDWFLVMMVWWLMYPKKFHIGQFHQGYRNGRRRLFWKDFDRVTHIFGLAVPLGIVSSTGVGGLVRGYGK